MTRRQSRRLSARIDDNQPAIVRALRDVGASVQSLASLGKGCPDLLVGYRGQNLLLEVKNLDGRGRALTADETAWHADWRGAVVVVESVEQALAAIGAVEDSKAAQI